MFKNIFSIIVIMISIAAFVLFVRPEYAEVQAMKKQSAQLDGVLDNAKKLQSLRNDLLEKQQSISAADIARIEKMIPENSDNVKLILEFQEIADIYGLEIQTASTEKDDGEDTPTGQNFDIQTRDYGIMTLDFTLSGGYNDFVNFLQHIEENLRIADVRNISLSPDGGEDNLDSYAYTMTIDTYWLKDNI